ncbi:MAG: alpha/beta fold hydrolase [Candidatus Tectimicrobiota bacterium]
MPSLALPGVHLWYQDTGGTGIPVVFLHAASGTCESWVYQEPAFRAAGYRCITYDRRGWGRSQVAPADPQPGDASTDLHGLVTFLGLERFHLVATAAGGIVGFDYAVEHPERVRSLVVANSISGVQDPAYLEVQQRLRPPEIQALPVELRELGPSYRGTNPEGVRRWLDIDHASQQPGQGRPGQRPRQPMTYARLATLQVPVLILVGEADLLSPPALMRLVAAQIPHCQFATIPEAGHAAFWEQPEVWNRLVLGFLTQCEVAATTQAALHR